MSLVRPLLLLAGVGALALATPGSATTWPDPPHPGRASTAESPALRMLHEAAWGSLARSWSGVQRIVTLQGGMPRVSVVEVDHTPGRGTAMQTVSTGGHALQADGQDARMLDVLAARYDLVLVGQKACAGRTTRVIEARRPGTSGAAAVAGRFWLDAETGMLVRRDVHDGTGALARSTTVERLSVGPERTAPIPGAPEDALDGSALAAMQAQGWSVPLTLPGGLALYEARWHEEPKSGVLQLAYSDGLSVMSLFVQPGELVDEPAGTARPLEDGGTVWVSGGDPERYVWSGGGRTWTLLSDAPDSTVATAISALPSSPQRLGDNPPARVWRGMAVVGAWLNPFR